MTTAMAVKERPILFSAPMVCALLSEAKTQTRRMVKPPLGPNAHWIAWESVGWKAQGIIADIPEEFRTGNGLLTCPYGVPGDRLWVRETWWMREADGVVVFDADGAISFHETSLAYQMGVSNVPCDLPRSTLPDEGFTKRPSIHMPRWASRITLEITDVRVQRLQEISEADAYAEGVTIREAWRIGTSGKNLKQRNEARCEFHELWNSIHPAGSSAGWDANPWVWAITFQRIG